MKQSNRKSSEDLSVAKPNMEGYKKIKDSIETITNGLRKKENTDMKLIINEIFNIKKIVEQNTL